LIDFKKYQIITILVIVVFALNGCLKITEPDLGEPLEDVNGSSLVINPLELHVGNGKTFMVRIYLSNVSNALGLFTQIKFDSDALSYYKSESVSDDGTNIDLSAVTQILFVDDDQSADTLNINMGFVGGNGKGISGTGDIFNLYFKALKLGNTEITILNGARITDNDLNEIEILQLKGSIVHVE